MAINQGSILDHVDKPAIHPDDAVYQSLTPTSNGKVAVTVNGLSVTAYVHAKGLIAAAGHSSNYLGLKDGVKSGQTVIINNTSSSTDLIINNSSDSLLVTIDASESQSLVWFFTSTSAGAWYLPSQNLGDAGPSFYTRDVFTASPTALAAAGALTANTYYHVTDTDGAAYTLPAIASSVQGDVIEVLYIAILANTEVHKYGTAGEFFADTSFVLKPSNATGNSAYVKDIADGAADDFLNLTGATDAGWGIGTRLKFIFNGSKWRVECHGKATGNGSTGATAAFATT